MQDAESILKPLAVPDVIKAQAWDIFDQSKDADEFAAKIGAMKIPKEAKAALWDLKNAGPGPPPQERQSPGDVNAAQALLAKHQPLSSQLYDVAKSLPMVGASIDPIIGAGKELGSTAWALGNRLQGTNPAPPIGPANGRAPLSQPIIQMADKKPDYLEPTNTGQKIGGALATMGEYAAPSAAAAKIPALANLGLAGQSVLQAALAGGVGTARGEDLKGAATDAAMAGGTTAVVGGVAKLLAPLGERIELAILKPVKSDLRGVSGPPEVAPQTMVKNLYKYDLGGTLDQSYTKATAKTTELGKQLRQALQDNPAGEVDLLAELSNTEKELMAKAPSQFGTNSPIKKALDYMFNEIVQVSPKSGKVNVADGQDIKQAVGAMGSWANGMRDADSTALETVANAYYTKLKTAIEGASGQSQLVRDINGQFSEIIPIKNAILRRIPVAARREPVSLKGSIALAMGDIKGLGLAAADMALRNGRVANAFVQAGKNPAAVGRAAAPLATGAVNAASDALTRFRQNPSQ